MRRSSRTWWGWRSLPWGRTGPQLEQTRSLQNQAKRLEPSRKLYSIGPASWVQLGFGHFPHPLPFSLEHVLSKFLKFITARKTNHLKAYSVRNSGAPIWIHSDLNKLGLNKYFINWINNLVNFENQKLNLSMVTWQVLRPILPRSDIRLQTLHVGSSSATLNCFFFVFKNISNTDSWKKKFVSRVRIFFLLIS